jgi:hypothetical protein
MNWFAVSVIAIFAMLIIDNMWTNYVHAKYGKK